MKTEPMARKINNPKTRRVHPKRAAGVTRRQLAAAEEAPPTPEIAPPSPVPAPAAAPEPEQKPARARATVKRWSVAETESVAKALVPRLRKQGFGIIPSADDRIGNQFLLGFLREAINEALPPERRRIIGTRAALSPLFWARLEDMLKAQLKAEDDAKREAAKALIAPPKAPEPVEPPKPKLADFSDEELIAETAVRLFRVFKQGHAAAGGGAEVREAVAKFGELKELNEMLMTDVADLQKRMQSMHANGNGSRATLLPRVAVLGCHKDQFDMLCAEARKLGVEADFKHYDQDWNPRPFVADYALTFRWVTHAWNDQAKAAVPNAARRAFITGGIDTGAQQVAQWLKPAVNGNGNHA